MDRFELICVKCQPLLAGGDGDLGNHLSPLSVSVIDLYDPDTDTFSDTVSVKDLDSGRLYLEWPWRSSVRVLTQTPYIRRSSR